MAFTTPPRTTDYTHFAEVEATYADIAATPSAGDAFRSRTKNLGFKSVVARLDRDQDADRSASVHSTALGRRSASFEFEAALCPSGVTGTPTAPDMGEFFRAHLGLQDVGVGHSTLTTGSTTTVLEGTAGAVAALGLVVGDFIAVDVSAAVGIELRQVTAIATDQITVDRALSGAPASGRAIYGCVTYKLSKSTLLSMILYSYLDGDFEHLCAGAAVADMEITYDLGNETPEPMVKFSGPAARVETLATSIPTPTLSTNRGIGPAVAYAWIGATKTCITKLALKSNNGQELRESESCGLLPTGIKRTGNNGRYKVELELEALLVGATIEGYYDNARALTAYDIEVQIGNVLGNGFGFRVPAFIPDAEESDVEGDVAIALKGRCYGNGTDDTELTVAFF